AGFARSLEESRGLRAPPPRRRPTGRALPSGPGGGQGGAPHGQVWLTPRMHVRHDDPSLGPHRHQWHPTTTPPTRRCSIARAIPSSPVPEGQQRDLSVVTSPEEEQRDLSRAAPRVLLRGGPSAVRLRSIG